MPPRLLTIMQAAVRHGSPRGPIDSAIRTGTLASTGRGRKRRVLAEDVDAMVPYHPRELEEAPDENDHRRLRVVFSPAEVRTLSYALTVAVGVNRLIGHEPEIVRDLQFRFAHPEEWERADVG